MYQWKLKKSLNYVFIPEYPSETTSNFVGKYIPVWRSCSKSLALVNWRFFFLLTLWIISFIVYILVLWHLGGLLTLKGQFISRTASSKKECTTPLGCCLSNANQPRQREPTCTATSSSPFVVYYFTALIPNGQVPDN